MKKLITFALALMLIFSLGMAVSAETAPVSGENISITHVDGVEAPEEGEAPAEDEIMPVEMPETPAPKKSGNSPYFIGAGIAVLVFIGVAFYCKTNGNKTL